MTDREFSFDLNVDGVQDTDTVAVNILPANDSLPADTENVSLVGGRATVEFTDERGSQFPVPFRIQVAVTRAADAKTETEIITRDNSTLLAPAPVVFPADGTELFAGVQLFRINPNIDGWRYRADVGGSEGEFGPNNEITAAVPANGVPFDVDFLIDRQDGSDVTVIRHTYTAFDAPDVPGISTPTLNPFNPTSASGTLTWTDNNPPATRNYDIAVNGVDQGPSVVNVTSYDLSNLPTDGQSHEIVLSYWDNGDLSDIKTETLAFTAFQRLSGTALDTSDMQAIDFGDVRALGTIGQSEVDAMMAPLARQFFTEGNRMAVQDVDGRRALCVEIDVDGATDNRPSGRASYGYITPANRTYRISQWVWVPSNFVGGGSKNNLPFGTAKIGFGLYTTTTVSGGNRNPNGASMRFIYDVETNNDLTLAIYDYSFDRSSDFGGRYNFPNKLVRGSWNYMAMEVTMNSSGGASDGIIRAWQDPDSTTPQIVVTGKRIMASDPPEWTRVRHETFLGGSGPNGRLYYTPDNDQELCIADAFIGAGSF